uniref:Uncharacterized protein n=1 Tax=uncultured prokaryote TaxID=198431 RepID=A0A0H5QM64_9ZZZZ|nr:hypothetical protein [uncultured prokaryote]
MSTPPRAMPGGVDGGVLYTVADVADRRDKGKARRWWAGRGVGGSQPRVAGPHSGIPGGITVDATRATRPCQGRCQR